jgi:hypothetical protein
LADWLSEPLAAFSAWRIESWRRDQFDSVAEPLLVDRQLQALDSCLSKAVEWQLIERNPLRDVSLEADTDRVVELFGGGDGLDYLREGWARIGVDWTWTLGKRAVIALPPVKGEADHVLKIRVAGSYKKNPQRLLIVVNEMTVGILLCRAPATYEFFVPASALNSRNQVEVVLEIPDACRPTDLDESTDTRFLGVRVAKIELRKVTRSNQKKQLQSPAANELPGVLEQRAALLEMVSLGYNCEFAFVQRHLGAEPISFFRWTAATLDKLVEGLNQRFVGLNSRDALDVQVTPEGEYAVVDKAYGFRRHTFVLAQAGVIERVLHSEYIRGGILCKSLLKELSEHNKLFVYHDAGASKLPDIRRLVRALQTYGDNTLLWIVRAPVAAQIGETRQVEHGLIQGYVSGFQKLPVTPQSPHLPSWVKVAYRAHQIWSRSKESRD